MRPELEDTVEAGADPARTATGPGRAAAPDSPGLATGRQLGHFRIERKIGAGGMGEVYLATDLALDRPVAIKVLPYGRSNDRTGRDRMIREARAQARVSHPNVGHLYFIGEEAGLLYFAMEYVAGKTLTELLATGPLPVDVALDVIRSTALGLREAQRSGFTHRDVKPSNLMVDGHGVVKVLDFGLAAGDPTASSEGPVEQTSLAGTPLYMAPEQARGEPVDFRTDIYALGATLFHLVAGAPPFQAESVEELVTLHANAARPALPRGRQPRTAIAAIDSLCAKMMAPTAADRFASYDELLNALGLASATHTRPAGFWARGIAAGVDMLIVLIVLALGLQLASALTDYSFEIGALLCGVLGLYTAIMSARWGRTLGKALFELEVVDVTASGARPTWRRATRRALAVFAVPTVLAATSQITGMLEHPRASDITNFGSVIWFPLLGLLLLHASARVHGKRAPWDRIAGTMVRYRTSRGSTI